MTRSTNLKKYIVLLSALLGAISFSACQTPVKSDAQKENPQDASHNKGGSAYRYR